MKNRSRKRGAGQWVRAGAMILSAAVLVLFGTGLWRGTKMPETFRVSGSGTFRLNGGWWTVTPAASPGTDCSGELKLLSIPIKEVAVMPVKRSTVTLGGTPFGLKLYTAGALIVGLVDVDGASGVCCPASQAGLQVGDVIRAINGTPIQNNSDAALQIQKSSGNAISVEYERDGTHRTVQLVPQRSVASGAYKAGLWIKDSCAGIGTLTYVTDDGVFAGLGHGITDPDTEALMPVQYGEIVPVRLVGVIRGARGAPGELKGYFASDDVQGVLHLNTAAGVYGQFRAQPVGQRIELALKQEVCRGEAQLWTTVTGDTPRAYAIRIERICYDNAHTQNMVIHVTDPDLLRETGGIVQGLSGSPILQNGRLVGAVTHVFVNDPTRGYAIFAENMQTESALITAQLQSAA